MKANLPSLCMTAILIIAVTVFAEAPATSQPAEQVVRWFGQLADDDPNVRETARISLMGLKREQLDMLRQIVEQNRPLAPAQSAALRSIVMHVYLSGEPYENNAGTGFLGVSLADVDQALPGAGNDELDPLARSAVLVTSTHPGFCGNRYLQPGDVIVGVLERALLVTPRRDVLRHQIMSIRPGETVALRLLRQGKQMQVSLTLDAQPVIVERQAQDVVEAFCNERLARAEQYWQETFEPLVAVKLSAL